MFSDTHTSTEGSHVSRQKGIFRRILVVFGLVVMTAIAVYGVSLLVHWRNKGLSVQCVCNSQFVGRCMLSYKEQYGHLPPAHVVASDGRLMHSWRILVSEHFMPTDPDPYDFKEPWDSVNNTRFGDYRPEWFACPNDSVTWRNRRLTNYFVVTGRNTPFPDAGTTVGPRGASNTILMVEARDLDIEWLEPRDLAFDRMSFIPNDPKRPSISSHHADGPFVLMADWSVRSIKGIDPGVLRRMLEYHPDEEDD